MPVHQDGVLNAAQNYWIDIHNKSPEFTNPVVNNAHIQIALAADEVAVDFAHCVPSLLFTHRGRYERFRERRADCVSVGAQSSHSGGNPISQRECAGFNRAPFAIPT